MQQVIVTVPMSKALKEKADAISVDLGFSSLEGVITMLLTKLTKKEITLQDEKPEEITYLSKKAERKFKKAVEEIKAGRNVTKTQNVDELLQLLHA